jgi:hypothetical protein
MIGASFGLFVAMMAALAGPATAQVDVDAAGQAERAPLSPEVARDLTDGLRQRLLAGAPDIAALIEAQVHPALLASVDMVDILRDMMWYSQPAIGCSDRGVVIAFYAPMTDMWLAVEVDGAGAMGEARLGQGFPAGPGRSAGWGDLLEGARDIPAAFQAATMAQMMAFDAIYGPGACPDFAAVHALSATEAVQRYISLAGEYDNVTGALGQSFLADLSEATGADLAGWRPEVRLRGTGEDWYVLFSSVAHPGRQLLARWEGRDDGLVYFAGLALIDFVPTGDAG